MGRSVTGPGRPYALAALQHPAVARVLREDGELLAALTSGLGSPLHVLLPAVVEQNIATMRATLAELDVDATILFAKKANKAACVAEAAANVGIGMDVASVPELVAALAAGVPGERIGVSGPEKPDALHGLALQHGCLVAVDSASELRRLGGQARRRGATARVLLRSRVGSQPHSRFGMTSDERAAAVAWCARHPEVVLEGFAFHLDGYSAAERGRAAHDLVGECAAARAQGLERCDRVDIGGGLPVRYVDPDDWAAFLRQNRPDGYHAGKVVDRFYPYGAQRRADDTLRDVMDHPDGAGEALRARASRLGVRFVLEPGRALLDQAGFTVFRVQQVQDRGDGSAIVTVAGSSFSLSEQWFGSEFAPDPVLLHAGAPAREFPAAVAGSTCLETDMLTWRRIGFPRPVVPGDHLVYLNTAGYQMDSNESPFHDVALPRKVVLRLGDGRPRWHLDDVDPAPDHERNASA